MKKLWKFEVEATFPLSASDPHIVESVPEIGYNPLEYLD